MGHEWTPVADGEHPKVPGEGGESSDALSLIRPV